MGLVELCETSWDFAADGPGLFRVRIACVDDAVGFDDPKMAERAIYDAAAHIEELIPGR